MEPNKRDELKMQLVERLEEKGIIVTSEDNFVLEQIVQNVKKISAKTLDLLTKNFLAERAKGVLAAHELQIDEQDMEKAVTEFLVNPEFQGEEMLGAVAMYSTLSEEHLKVIRDRFTSSIFKGLVPDNDYIPHKYEHAVAYLKKNGKKDVFEKKMKEEIIAEIKIAMMDSKDFNIESFIQAAIAEEERSKFKLALGKLDIVLEEREKVIERELERVEKFLSQFTQAQIDYIKELHATYGLEGIRERWIPNSDPGKEDFKKLRELGRTHTLIASKESLYENILKKEELESKREENNNTRRAYIEKREKGIRTYLEDLLPEENFRISSLSGVELHRIEAEYYRRESELASLMAQSYFLENLYGDKLKSGEPIYVYRACSKFDEPEKGLFPKSPDSSIHTFEHIANGTSKNQNYSSPYISVTQSPYIMSLFALDKDNPMEGNVARQVAIDLSTLYMALQDRKSEILSANLLGDSERNVDGNLGQWNCRLPSEIAFLEWLRDKKGFESEKVEQRMAALSNLSIYVDNNSLPTSIFDISSVYYIEKESELLDEPETRFSSSAKNARVNAEKYGTPTLEFLVTGSIPAQVQLSNGETKSVISDIDPLTSDIIQCIRPSQKSLDHPNSIVNLNCLQYLQEEKIQELGLPPVYEEFARIWYCSDNGVQNGEGKLRRATDFLIANLSNDEVEDAYRKIVGKNPERTEEGIEAARKFLGEDAKFAIGLTESVRSDLISEILKRDNGIKKDLTAKGYKIESKFDNYRGAVVTRVTEPAGHSSARELEIVIPSGTSKTLETYKNKITLNSVLVVGNKRGIGPVEENTQSRVAIKLGSGGNMSMAWNAAMSLKKTREIIRGTRENKNERD